MHKTSTSQSANPKRLAKNTIFLYIRTFIVMLVSLYTSRVVLDALGVEDYGIYNVVGGIIIMFSVISASLSNSIIRYITYELGKGDIKKLKLIFSTSINIQIIIAFYIVILTEIVGVWFINTQMNIPENRLTAAFWVLQCSLLTFVIQLISLPFNAALIAHEKMDIFAYIGLLEAILKLSCAYAIFIFNLDKLIIYAACLALSAIIIRIIYGIYCKKHFEECKYHILFDKSLIKEMSDFAGWNFLGTSAYLLNTQGVNILSNIFFGVTVNAARGIAGQAETGVRQFVGNFTTALNPQIIKSYAEKDYDTCFSIVRKGGKYSFFLMLFLFIPFILESEFILNIWLKEVPKHTVLFWQLAMLETLVDLPGAPITTLAQATGKIKKFYIYMGGLGCLVLPISYILFKLDFPPSSAYWTYVVVYTYLVYVRLVLMKKQVGFPIILFVKEVIIPIIIVSLLSFIIPFSVLISMEPGIIRFIVIGITSTLSICTSVILVGMDKTEKKKVISYLKRKIIKT